MKRETNPLAVDADLKTDTGIPIRMFRVGLPACLIAAWLYYLPFLQGDLKMWVPLVVWTALVGSSLVQREGIWIGTWIVYRAVAPLLPWVIDGRPVRARVTATPGIGVQVDTRTSRPSAVAGRAWGVLPLVIRKVVQRAAVRATEVGLALPAMPRATVPVEGGLFELRPGGWRGVVRVDPPTEARYSDEYGAWTESVIRWLTTVGVPAQFYAVCDNFDPIEAQRGFELGYRGPNDWIKDQERNLVGRAASTSLAVRHYVILCPGMALADGVPLQAKVTGILHPPTAERVEVERALVRALNVARDNGVKATRCDHEDVARLLMRTPLMNGSAAFTPTCSQIGTDLAAVVVATTLPSELEAGLPIQVMLEKRVRGAVCLYLAPVEPTIAYKKIDPKRRAFEYQAHAKNDIGAREMAAGLNELSADLHGHRRTAHLVALGFDVRAHDDAELESTVGQLMDHLKGEGLRPVRCGNPGYLPHLSVSPGCAPLARSLMRPLVSNSIAACLVPALGTAFARPWQPYVGNNLWTGMPVYFNAFEGRDNMNVIILGQMGTGKSVCAKTLLLRHHHRGIRLIVVDPHSEYRKLMAAIGGVFIELGDEGMNPLAVDPSFSPDQAAAFCSPVLSVMAGDEKGTNSQGYPVRRLKDEDKGWLHGHVARFFKTWRVTHADEQPLLRDLVEYLRARAMPNRGEASEDEYNRALRIIERLRSFTVGERAEVFNRPMRTDLSGKTVAYGLKKMLHNYGSDLTAALAMILSHVLREMLLAEDGLIVDISEAHFVLGDPDVSAVVDRMARGVRKDGVALWIDSQQVDDVLQDGLGKTLAGNAATKIIMGLDKTVAATARDAFGLTDAEVTAVTEDYTRGRAVIVSGRDRAFVEIIPGDHLMDIVKTTHQAQTLELVA